ncbi:MAG: RNA polymerase sigma factor [Candidatus Omnitrophica bacterium]|nr:RNA polymerase sigma factor [Candidatus Omnitrophota bacterium]
MNLFADSDWQLIERVQSGDKSAFNEIFSRHKTNLINLAFRFTRSREAAEDIAQEIFIKIYEGKVKTDPKAKFTTWLYRVAVNAAIDVSRKRKYTPHSLDVREDFKDSAIRHTTEVLTETEIKARVQNEIANLPEKFRSPILLYQFEEMSYREIAAVLGITEKAVERRIYHAKEALRKKLGGLL